jgi:hypothetical protein
VILKAIWEILFQTKFIYKQKSEGVKEENNMDPYLNSYEYLFGCSSAQPNKENSKHLFLANEASRNNWNFNRQTEAQLNRTPESYWNRSKEPKQQPFGNKYTSNTNTKKN